MSDERLKSYTAAGILPVKVLLHPEVYRSVVESKHIPLIHVQLNPTTRCQLDCKFCSCRNQEKKQDIPFEMFKKIINGCAASNALAATVTGGGEPTLYPHINEALDYCLEKGLEVGLVTNGYSIEKVSMAVLGRCTWLRMSVSDQRGLAPKPKESLRKLVPLAPEVDWSFSYVVTKDIDYEKMAEVVAFANEYKFTHVRLVSDLLDLDNVSDMRDIRSRLSGMVNDELVIYQGRKEFTRGQKDCWISLLKTLVSPDGRLFGCCGVQYAEDPPAMKYSDTMSMGDAVDIKRINEEQTPFDGSKCVRCYYGDYNKLLSLLLSKGVEHMNFV